MGVFCDRPSYVLSVLLQTCFFNDYEIKGLTKEHGHNTAQESLTATL